GKSKIQIKINTELESSDIYNYQPLPHHKNGKRKCDVCNTNYCKKAFSLKAIKPGKEIYIIFCFLKSLINEIESLIYLTFIL
ncbi:MAG: hypothetical protein NZ530_03995, partial [Thermodesulfobacteriaceae bacterium]|nr:hypothetical protein [Thermodesulfobacteriaceae bacterium]